MEPFISLCMQYWQGYLNKKSDIRIISLSDYKGKYTVLLFYPFDFTYVCPTELVAFSEAT